MASDSQEAFELLLQMDRQNLERRRVAEEMQQESGRTQYIRYRVGRNLFLIAVGDVIELMPMPRVTPVPFSKQWIAGVTNIRGDVYVVTDFYNFLYDEPRKENKKNKLLVLKGDAHASLIVDEVLGMAELMKSEILEDNANPDDLIAPFVGGAASIDSDNYFIVNLNKLVSEPRFMQAAV
ncbi:MAG: purine-binding chemotaxis protein CheW [Gammaproteobacteria bacterium]|nr:purine-binding chemotaxis protein CheW [Gammaproteobacteria bacterium]